MLFVGFVSWLLFVYLATTIHPMAIGTSIWALFWMIVIKRNLSSPNN